MNDSFGYNPIHKQGTEVAVLQCFGSLPFPVSENISSQSDDDKASGGNGHVFE